MRKLPGMLFVAAFAVASLGGAAAADPASVAIGPNQTFVGLVNGRLANAKVDVMCFGPSRVGEMGHPTSGQTMGVMSPSPSTASVGNTGSGGRSIVAADERQRP